MKTNFMTFAEFAKVLHQLETTASRNEMTKILAELFKKVKGQEIGQVCYLVCGRLLPKYEGVEFNLAEKLMVRAIGQALGRSIEEVTKVYKETGDLGETVFKIKDKRAKSKNEIKKLKISVTEVYNKLMEIAKEEGEGSVERKINSMAEMIKDLDALSVKYLVRIPVNKMRLGFSDMTILDALSWMEKGDKSLRPEIERAFNVSADIGRIAKVFKNKGLRGLNKVQSEAGVPIRAALSERLPSLKKILEKLDNQVAVELKFDGLRLQIHFAKSKEQRAKSKDKTILINLEDGEGMVRMFSRNMDNVTNMFPDVAAAIRDLAKDKKIDNIILDGEAIAFNPLSGKLMAFQETVKRKRKHGIAQALKDLPIRVYVYDLLLINGKSYLNKAFKERRKQLEQLFEGRTKKDTLVLAEQHLVDNTAKMKRLFDNYVAQGLEGAMFKKLGSVYQAGSRNFNWVKYKPTTEGTGLLDTIDCLVLGLYGGKGKRTKFGVGAFLAGLIKKSKIKKGHKYDIREKEGFVTVSKVGTGLTDEQWREMKRRCQSLVVDKQPLEYQVPKGLKPDYWLAPGLVVEIKADEVTKSPLHTAGLALRFPRLVRFRDDKSADEVTTVREIERMKR